jgi:hypothetical protein
MAVNERPSARGNDDLIEYTKAMPLAGTPLVPRKVARALYDAGWLNAVNLLKMLATMLAESQLCSHAWHYNSPMDSPPGDGSTDWGPFQLNDGNKGGRTPISGPDGLPVPQEGGSKSLADVLKFRDMACNLDHAMPVARDLYERRAFQPWAAFNSGAWKKYIPTASYAIRNMLHEMFGVPLG